MRVEILRSLVLFEAVLVGVLALALTPTKAEAACENKRCLGSECSTWGLNCSAQGGRYCTCTEVGCVTYECQPG